MKTKSIKLITPAILCAIGIVSLNALPVFADDVCNSNASQEVKQAAGCYGNTNALPGIIQNILNSVILVGGVIAAIFIVVGGINYMTSSGDAGKTKKARDTILYACIGLVVCALAFVIVNWVITIVANA